MSDVDRGVFEREALIERLEGDEELLAEIVGLFLEDAPSQIQKVDSAISGGVAVDALRAAHSLKGAAANVGAPKLRQTALDIERLAGAGELSEAARVCERLSSEFNAFKQVVETLGLAPGA